MTNLLKLSILLLAVTLGWMAFSRDSRLRRELKAAKAQVTQDSLARVAAVAQTDTARQIMDSLVVIRSKTDTIFRATRQIIRDTIERLVRSTIPETIKIKELVKAAQALDSAATRDNQACTEALSACELFKVRAGEERQRWERERADLAGALKIAEKLGRHWGLGGACGGAVVIAGSTVRAGPGCTLGFVYRW